MLQQFGHFGRSCGTLILTLRACTCKLNMAMFLSQASNMGVSCCEISRLDLDQHN